MRRVEGVDAAFLASETPDWPFHVSALQIVDPSEAPEFGIAWLRQLLERRLHLIPQFRWRLVDAPLGIGWSFLADDPDFDLDRHLHQIAVPSPGNREQLARLVSDLISRPIDRRIPLWEMWMIEGLEHGRVALLTKVHHSIIDGQSGADVVAALYDLTPESPVLPDPPDFAPGPLPSWLEVAARNGVKTLTLPWRAARFGRQLVEQGIAALPATFGANHAARPFQAPRTPFNGQLSPHRSFASASLPLELVKDVRRAAGVKVNDVVLSVCAGALRNYLESRDALPAQPLIAQVPVSTRTEATRAEIGTQVGSMFVSLATDLADPVERLGTVQQSSAAAKLLHGTLAERKQYGVSDTIPPTLFGVASRMWAMTHLDAHAPPIYNVIISNVAGPPMDFYIAGARNVSMFPMGPLLYGSGLNITVFSNGSSLDFGVVTCRELVPDPWPIADGFAPALDELASAVLHRRPRSRAGVRS